MVLVLKNGATKQSMEALGKKLKGRKGVNTKKYCGIINLKDEPLSIQKKLRDEWG